MEGCPILRIVAGKYGGRAVRAPAGISTRPTSQRVREALFNILAPRVDGAVFADLFAGSGAVGIEALSRGAGKILFVDRDAGCVNLIRENLTALGASPPDVLAVAADLSSAAGLGGLRGSLARLGAEAADIVFADPPYALAEITSIPARLAESGVLAAGAILIVEHGAKLDMPARVLPPAASCSGVTGSVGPVRPLEKLRVRRYGDTALSFYTMNAYYMNHGNDSVFVGGR